MSIWKVVSVALTIALIGVSAQAGYIPDIDLSTTEFNNTIHSPTPTETVRASTQSATSTKTAIEGIDQKRLERLIHVEINERRQKEGKRKLDIESQLREVARMHAKTMAAEHDTFHTDPSGDDFQDRYQQVGYTCEVENPVNNKINSGAENVLKMWYQTDVNIDGESVSYDTPKELAGGIVDLWMNSKPHRENILAPYWRNEGIGVAITEEDGHTVVYVTQNFC